MLVHSWQLRTCVEHVGMEVRRDINISHKHLFNTTVNSYILEFLTLFFFCESPSQINRQAMHRKTSRWIKGNCQVLGRLKISQSEQRLKTQTLQISNRALAPFSQSAETDCETHLWHQGWFKLKKPRHFVLLLSQPPVCHFSRIPLPSIKVCLPHC